MPRREIMVCLVLCVSLLASCQVVPPPTLQSTPAASPLPASRTPWVLGAPTATGTPPGPLTRITARPTGSPTATHTPPGYAATLLAALTPPGKLSGAPPARVGHSMEYDARRQVVVLFGGWREVNPRSGNVVGEPLTDTWEYDGLAWRQVHTANWPNDGIGMTYDARRGRVVGFDWLAGASQWEDGGAGSTWEYDGVDWREIDLPNQPRLFLPSMAYDAGRQAVLLFGDTDWGQLNYQTWAYDGEAWRLLDVGFPKPQSGELCLTRPILPSLAYDMRRGAMVMNDDSCVFRLADQNWELVRPREGDKGLPGRVVSQLVYDTRREVIVLFGAGDPANERNETWEYDGTRWYRATPLQSPPLYSGFGLAYDAARGVTVLFGGGLSYYDLQNDTWEYDGLTWWQR